MRAALLHQYGHEHITIAELDAPRPGPGEVLVTVEAASINPADAARSAVSGDRPAPAQSRSPAALAARVTPMEPGWRKPIVVMGPSWPRLRPAGQAR